MTKYTTEYFVSIGYDYGNAAEAALAYEQGDGQDSMAAVSQWLNDYKGNFEFYLSVKAQYEKKGFLSDKQKEAIERAIARDNARVQAIAVASQPTEVVEWHNPTFPTGTTLKISRGVAKAIAEEKGFEIAFRKVEVVKTHRETSKAVYVTVKFSSQIGHFCGICGRGLTHPVSQATGIGPECASKLNITRYSMETAKLVLSQISDKLTAMGEIKVWLPKSKIEKMGA